MQPLSNLDVFRFSLDAASDITQMRFRCNLDATYMQLRCNLDELGFNLDSISVDLSFDPLI